MNILVNGIDVMIEVNGILTVQVSCDSIGPLNIYEKLCSVFKKSYRNVTSQEEIEDGFIKFQVPECQTELEAIDFMRTKGYGVVQKITL